MNDAHELIQISLFVYLASGGDIGVERMEPTLREEIFVVEGFLLNFAEPMS